MGSFKNQDRFTFYMTSNQSELEHKFDEAPIDLKADGEEYALCSGIFGALSTLMGIQALRIVEVVERSQYVDYSDVRGLLIGTSVAAGVLAIPAIGLAYAGRDYIAEKLPRIF